MTFGFSEFPVDPPVDPPKLRLTRSDLHIFSPFALTAAILALGLVFSAAAPHKPSAPWAIHAINIFFFAHLPLACFLIYRERGGVRVFAFLISALATATSFVAWCLSNGSILGEWS